MHWKHFLAFLAYESFRNYKGLGIILYVILNFTKVRIFLIPLSIAFSNPKILGFLFLQKIALPGDWNAKNWTLEIRREFTKWYALKIVHKRNGHLGIF